MLPIRDEEDTYHMPPLTLVGMSGIGKTFLSERLAGWGWHHYSCDLEIGQNYLHEEIVETLSDKDNGFKMTNTITADDLSLLSEFVGRLGDPAQGGLPLDEFKRRQKLYYDAECEALNEFMTLAERPVEQRLVNDATGSLCEIEEPDLHERLAACSLYVYIKASEEEEQAVLLRAQKYPKPLLYSPALFDGWVENYLEEKSISADQIDPDDFARRVFPHLFAARLPKYQDLADKYGITIPSSHFKDIQTEQDFMKVIDDHIPDENRENLYRRRV